MQQPLFTHRNVSLAMRRCESVNISANFLISIFNFLTHSFRLLALLFVSHSFLTSNVRALESKAHKTIENFSPLPPHSSTSKLLFNFQCAMRGGFSKFSSEIKYKFGVFEKGRRWRKTRKLFSIFFQTQFPVPEAAERMKCGRIEKKPDRVSLVGSLLTLESFEILSNYLKNKNERRNLKLIFRSTRLGRFSQFKFDSNFRRARHTQMEPSVMILYWGMRETENWRIV